MLQSALRLSLLLCAALLHPAESRRPLILVSCDGFRYDYLDWYPGETAFLRSLIPRGVHVNRMTPAFATKTFPNHWTIATGLYQESHGILNNVMYDPVFNENFTKATRDERWWNASLPIWIEAKKQGLKSATFFWPGSEVSFQGVRQDHLYDYKDAGVYNFTFRVNKVLDWITKEGIDFATMYLDQPDAAGHRHGPESAGVREAVGVVDATIRSLFDGLRERGVSDRVDVVIVSDHGMTGLQRAKVINLTDSLDRFVDRVFDTGSLLAVNAKPGLKQSLLDFLESAVRASNLSMRVFSKETLPSHYHYANNRRAPDVLVLPHQDYLVLTGWDTNPPSAGSHGFDNAYSDMKVPMFAVGPSFRRNVQLQGFRQVDIYGLLCRLLDIRPQPNNGSLELLPLMLNGASGSRPWMLGWTNGCLSVLLCSLVKMSA